MKHELLGWSIILFLLGCSLLEIRRTWKKKSEHYAMKVKPSAVITAKFKPLDSPREMPITNSILWVDKCCNEGKGIWWCDCR